MPKTSKEYTSYQRYVIEFLTQKCANQDGILLYHYMGSGKTFTAIGLAANLDKPVVLLAPKGLLSMWQSDYFIPYKRIIPKGISKMLSYEEFWDEMEKMGDKGKAWRSKHLLIADEAHNLSAWLSHRLPVERRHVCLKYLFQFGKRVLLTGTPIYWGERDLSFLTNVVSGKVLLPIDDNAFRNKYYSVIKKRSLLEGWVAPVSRDLFRLVGTATITASTSTVIYPLLPPGKMHVLMGLMQKASVGITTAWYVTVCAAVRPFLEPVMAKLVSNKSTRTWLHAHGSNKHHRASHTAQKWRFQQIPNIPSYMANSLPMSPDELQTLGTFFTQKVVGRKQNLMLAGQAPYLILTLIILYVMHAVIKRYFTRESDLELLKLDYSHLVKDIGPYISYYKPDTMSANSRSWRKWLSGGPPPSLVHRSVKRLKGLAKHHGSRKSQQKNTGVSTTGAIGQSATFPRVHNVIETVSYSKRQTALFMRYTLGRMSFKDYTQLTILQNEAHGAVTSFDQASPENFRYYGRMIGNSCVFGTSNHNTSSYAYFENIEYDREDLCYKLKSKHTFKSVSPKIRAIYERFNEHAKRRVVYSNFNEASASLSAYLASKGIVHRYLCDPEPNEHAKPAEYDKIMKWVQANDGAVLILGQSYSEGLSVRNVDEMHIMEPCESVAKNDQTKGRVARLDSHPPGSTVQIIEWVTTMSVLTRFLKSTKEWFENSPYVWYTDLITSHKQGITPDAVVHREVHRLSKSTDKVIQLLQKRSIEQYVKTGIPSRCESNKHELIQVSA